MGPEIYATDTASCLKAHPLYHRGPIELHPPITSPEHIGLDRILPGMEFVVPHLVDGVILTKNEYFRAIMFLLTDPSLQEFWLKAMHYELSAYEERVGKKLDTPEYAMHMLARAVSHAIHAGVRGTVSLDIFSAQFENGNFSLSHHMPDVAREGRVNALSRSQFARLQEEFPSQFAFETQSFRQKRSQLLQGLRSLIQSGNIHALLDALPDVILNIIRFHDHRKGAVFTFNNIGQMCILFTGNFDEPHNFDAGLVITNPDIIEKIIEYWKENPPRNHTFEEKGWHLYQDGEADLDPLKPDSSSPVLSRVRKLIGDRDTHTITWVSQFLPDIEELGLMERRLASGELRNVHIYAPSLSLWRPLYIASGGITSYFKIQELLRKYPNNVKLNMTKSRYLHAKCIIVNDDRLLFGSHNFIRNLIRARTTELVLEYDHMMPHTRGMIGQFLASMDRDCE